MMGWRACCQDGVLANDPGLFKLQFCQLRTPLKDEWAVEAGVLQVLLSRFGQARGVWVQAGSGPPTHFGGLLNADFHAFVAAWPV